MKFQEIRLYAFTLITLLIISCSGKNELLSHTQLIAKYIVLDEKASENHHKCSEAVVQFNKMEKYDCSFLLGRYKFDIEYKYFLYDDGSVKDYWRYKGEGPMIYTREELMTDSQYIEHIGAAHLKVTLSQDRKFVYDTGDTLEIERVYLDEKLIFIKENPRARRFIYQYE